jgi:putative endonuclease
VDRARRAYGTYGEALAARWYEAQGYRVVARNWRCREGELDLVLEREGTVVFCEVKARATPAFGTGFDAVTPAKQAKVRLVARRFLAENAGGWRAIRFDVAAVSGSRVEVLPEAF